MFKLTLLYFLLYSSSAIAIPGGLTNEEIAQIHKEAQERFAKTPAGKTSIYLNDAYDSSLKLLAEYEAKKVAASTGRSDLSELEACRRAITVYQNIITFLKNPETTEKQKDSFRRRAFDVKVSTFQSNSSKDSRDQEYEELFVSHLELLKLVSPSKIKRIKNLFKTTQ